MKISKIIPLNLRNYLRRISTMKNYDVLLHKGSDGTNTIFEGKNILRSNTKLNDSFCGYATTISENTKLRKVSIGKYCSLGQNVTNALGMHPSRTFVSTHPSFYAPSEERLSFTNEILFQKYVYVDEDCKYLTKIGNDVWIGNNVTLFDGVEIGDGAIIGTGAVVTKNIEPYAIVGGIPAKLIRYRFTNSQIEQLLEIKWWNKDVKWIKENKDLFLDIDLLLNKIKISR